MSNFEYRSTYKKEVPSSTPKDLHIFPRKPIRHENSVSPITKGSGHNIEPRVSSKEPAANRIEERSHSDNTASESSRSDDSQRDYSSQSYLQESSYESKNHSSQKRIVFTNRNYNNDRVEDQRQESNGIFLYGVIIIIVGVIIAVLDSARRDNTVETTNAVTIRELHDYFPLQSEDIWNALESGIKEVKNFKKPSVFLLLYEDKAEETLNDILKNVSKYAVCIINENCEIQPIVLTSTSISTEKARIDYGHLIDIYKPELEKKGVMIVKDLDKVPGEVAQAFHSMCDEYTPLVGKSVFFFTMKMENLKMSPVSDLQVIEELLRTNWSDLKDDIFYPLFTRISNIVLRVVPEKILN